MSELNLSRKKIALISGGADEAYQSVLARNFTARCNEKGASVLWFMSLSDKYDGDPHDIGEVNIYNLVNFDAIDAIAIMSLVMKHDESTKMLLKKAKEKNIPVVSIDTVIDDVYSISLGYESALFDVISHLIDHHGVTKLNFLGGVKGSLASDKREEVFRRVMAEHNFPIEEDTIGYGQFWSTPTKQVVLDYYEKHKSMPEAFVCANDSMALGVCQQLEEMGFKVPDDVIVTGIDGIKEASTYSPTITTVKLRIAAAGETAADRIIQILDGEIPRVGVEIIDGERLYRSSCGCHDDDGDVFSNEIKHNLYGAVDEWNDFSNKLINMVESATGESSFDKTMKKMEVLLKEVWTRCCWICLCDNFIEKTIDIEDEYTSNQSYTQVGYGEYINYTLEYSLYKEGISRTLPPFKTAEIIPDLDKVLEDCPNLMFFPLHFQDRTLGYLAVEYTDTKRNFYIFNTFVTNISMVIENARIQSELRKVVKKLEDMYIRDSMTNLLNRRGFYQFAPKVYKKCIGEKQEFMVISVDLNGLKPINDIHGHKEGDNAITVAAQALTEASNGNEIIARFGGDEYVVAGRCPDEKYAEEYIKRFTKYLDDYNKESGKPYIVEASCGLYKQVPEKGVFVDEFIKIADELMYIQKVEIKSHRKTVRDEN